MASNVGINIPERRPFCWPYGMPAGDEQHGGGAPDDGHAENKRKGVLPFASALPHAAHRQVRPANRPGTIRQAKRWQPGAAVPPAPSMCCTSTTPRTTALPN